ncbi:MAG: hypothetical protein HFI75_14840 [Lachnospiraceae bacterium]|nr:hypothetical protein [Lachnospiraceae bacterium]
MRRMRKLCVCNENIMNIHQQMEQELQENNKQIMHLNLSSTSHYDYVIWNLEKGTELRDVKAVADRIREDTHFMAKNVTETPKTLLEYEEMPYNTWESGVLFEYALYHPKTGIVNFSFLASMLDGIKVEEINVAVSGWGEESIICTDSYTYSDSTKQIKEFMDIKVPARGKEADRIKVRGTAYISKNGCYLAPIVVEQYCVTAGEIREIKVDAPVIKVQGHTEVRIGLGREAYSADLDYHFQDSSCLQLENRGRIFLQSGITANVSATQGSCLIRKAPAGVSMTQADFTFTYNSGANMLSYSSKENWGKYAPWSPGDLCDITNTINISIQSGRILPVVITSVQNSRVEGSDSELCSIPQLLFLWGCLAEDTKIRMADGSECKIQDIQVGDQLACGTGNSALTVAEIWSGIEEQCLCIKTKAGKITATKEHPIRCPQGFKQAGELQKGDSILTADGYQQIEDITCVSYNGKVYNFDLGTEAELSHHLETTMIANGIIVGDNRVQGRCIAERKG